MSRFDEFFRRYTPAMLSILRIVIGLLFMHHGSQKLFGVPPLPNGMTIPLMSLAGAAGIIEFFGGLLFLIGLWTRPVAFILSGEMAMAYFMQHAPQGFWPLANHGEPAILFSFIYLYFIFAGGGRWSVDYRMERRLVE